MHVHFMQASARAVGSGNGYGTKAGDGAQGEDFAYGRANQEREKQSKATRNGNGRP